jgi:hypothetical protein
MTQTGSGGFGFVFDSRTLLIALGVIALLGLGAWLFSGR